MADEDLASFREVSPVCAQKCTYKIDSTSHITTDSTSWKPS